MFTGLQITKDDTGYRTELTELDDDQLGDGDVTVRIDYSTLNYKDALAITGTSPIVRTFPMTPGIDFAGTVDTSTHPGFVPGHRVVLNGWGVGESHPGGLAQRARVSGDWLIPLPEAFTTRQAMIIGTAGYTAMLCVLAIQRHGVTPEDGPVLVTGASGGVGSVAVAVLARLGYTVVASTGRAAESGYLTELGASDIIDRAELESPGKPLGKERWAAAVDSVGSHTLANVCATTAYRGIVAACGLAGGMDFPATVAPFILRGVTLAGIDSVRCPREQRQEAWARLGELLDTDKLELLVTTIALADTFDAASDLLGGRVRGRLLVDVNR